MPAEVAVEELIPMDCVLEDGWQIGHLVQKNRGRPAGNVRAVALIAKPQKVRDLKALFEGPLLNLLNEVPGFAGAILLNCQNEWRRMIVLTFWETEAQAANCHWEDYSMVRRLITPLVDLPPKVETYEALLPMAGCAEVEVPLNEPS